VVEAWVLEPVTKKEEEEEEEEEENKKKKNVPPPYNIIMFRFYSTIQVLFICNVRQSLYPATSLELVLVPISSPLPTVSILRCFYSFEISE
jgi:hypothetical protein